MGENIMTTLIKTRVFYNALIFLTFLASNLSYADTTSLEIHNNCIISTSSNSIAFREKASNDTYYTVGLSCFKNNNGYKEGELRVLKSISHVGAHINFPYANCLDMKRSLQEGTIKILLENTFSSWI